MALFMITCCARAATLDPGIRINGLTWNSGAEFYAYSCCLACQSYHEWCARDVTLGDEAEATDRSSYFDELKLPRNHRAVRFRITRRMETSGFASEDDRS